MEKIRDFIERTRDGITSKRLVSIFAVLSIVLLAVLASVMLSDSAAESVGNLLGIERNKTKITQLIGWAMSGIFIAIWLVVLNWLAKEQVECNRLTERGYTQFNVTAEYMGEIVNFMKRIRGGMTNKWIWLSFSVWLVALFVVLVSVIFFDSVVEWVGGIIGIKNNKIETIEFIGWVMSGILVAIGFVVLSGWVESQVQYNRLAKNEYANKTTKYSKKSAIGSIVGKWIMLFFTIFLIALLGFLLLVLVSVMFSDSNANDSMVKEVGYLLGITNKIKIIEFVGWAISGAIAAIGLVVLSWRAEAQLENNKLVEKGHTQERFKTATEHLGHKNLSIRMAASYEFLHLIKDNGEEYRKSILDILYVHVRAAISEFANREDVKNSDKNDEPIKFPEEIQGLLDILFKSPDIDRSDIKPNLQRVYFSGANLEGGNLSGANLSKADLSGAVLSKVNLSGANLSEVIWHKKNWSKTNVFGADLSKVDLSGAFLFNTNLSRVTLFDANLSGARLCNIDFSGSDLVHTNLSGADLFYANLSGTILSHTNLSGADLSGTNLSGAHLSKARLEGAFYTDETKFPNWVKEWLALKNIEVGADGKKRVPLECDVVPEKPEDDE